MILYHGSFIEVPLPDLSHSRETLDFGRGFYTTPIRAQAEKWAERFKRQGKPGVLNFYEWDDTVSKEFNQCTFDSYSASWLDFILLCRKGNDQTAYDIVTGGVANDQVFNTVELYFDHLIDKTEAIRRLRFEKPNLQVCFRTEQALKALRFIRSEIL